MKTYTVLMDVAERMDRVMCEARQVRSGRSCVVELPKTYRARRSWRTLRKERVKFLPQVGDRMLIEETDDQVVCFWFPWPPSHKHLSGYALALEPIDISPFVYESLIDAE